MCDPAVKITNNLYPEEIVHHVGTNNISKDGPYEIGANIKSVSLHIHNIMPLSEKDYPGLYHSTVILSPPPPNFHTKIQES